MGDPARFYGNTWADIRKKSYEQRDSPPIVQLKIAVDGAKMSRMSNFLIFSLAVF